MGLRSFRWRIASFYAVLLLGVMLVVAVVLTVEMRRILLDTARVKVDRIGTDISRLAAHNSSLSAIGDALPVDQELTLPGNLDHWSSPTTYVEVDTADGYPEGKSTNMGSATFAPSPKPRPSAIVYRVEHNALGDLLVRDELIRYPGVALIVKVGEALDLYDEAVRRIRWVLAAVVGLAAIAAVAGSFALAASAIEPINRLIAAMREIRSDQLNRRVGWSSRSDELGTLANTFDAMLDRLEEGFARERQFISDASHELKTPLTVINANAQLLERWGDRDPDVRVDSLRAIRDESAALASMVNGMLLLAKAESGDDIPREPLALDEVIADAVKTAKPRADEKSLGLVFAPPREFGPLVLGDANLLRQLFTNLLDNAIKFTEQGRIDVTVSAANGRALVEVSDTGIGIDEDALERIFDRFYRTDKSRNRQVVGTGLGLAIVRSIARIHDGTVEASRNPAGGTVFRVNLPTFTPLS